jgi:photosystem II stability/assembly factor-like uncharacterized protein
LNKAVVARGLPELPEPLVLFFDSGSVSFKKLRNYDFTLALIFLVGLEAGLTPQTEGRELIYRSLDDGQTWSPLTQNLPKETEVSFLHRRGQQIVMATDSAGIFVSDDKKLDWRQIGSGLPGKKITALHLSGSDIYAGVYQQGIYWSQDDGAVWQTLNADLKDLRVRDVLKVRRELVIATDSGIFQTSSGQAKWIQRFSACQVISLNADQGKIIAGSVLGVLRSMDEGNHWEWIHQQGSAHNSAILDGKIFVMNISNDLLVSEDGGGTWAKCSYSPRERSYVYDVAKVGANFVMSNNYGIRSELFYGGCPSRHDYGR